MNCSDCKFYEIRGTKSTCHRFPPTGGAFTQVRKTDWCGEFKARPVNKVKPAVEDVAEPEEDVSIGDPG